MLFGGKDKEGKPTTQGQVKIRKNPFRLGSHPTIADEPKPEDKTAITAAPTEPPPAVGDTVTPAIAESYQPGNLRTAPLATTAMLPAPSRPERPVAPEISVPSPNTSSYQSKLRTPELRKELPINPEGKVINSAM